MTEITKKHEEVEQAIPANENLSEAIEQSVDREPDEEVKVVRVFGDRYRCNWWVRDKTAQAMFLASGAIRRSKFFKARRTPDGVVLEDLSKPS